MCAAEMIVSSGMNTSHKYNPVEANGKRKMLFHSESIILDVEILGCAVIGIVIVIVIVVIVGNIFINRR